MKREEKAVLEVLMTRNFIEYTRNTPIFYRWAPFAHAFAKMKPK